MGSLFERDLKIINVGTPFFIEDLALQGVEHVHLAWRPPVGGDASLIEVLDKIAARQDVIAEANDEVLRRIKAVAVKLIGVKRAGDVIPGLDQKTILHAGPPIDWAHMSGPMRGAVVGALLYEGLASSTAGAIALVERGEVGFAPCHDYGAVGPMAGIVSSSMPVHVLYDEGRKSYAYCTINEGLGKVLRYGANGDDVLERLRWIEKEFAPVMDAALAGCGGVDIGAIIAQALHMGDECHNRNKAATGLFLREVMLHVLNTDFPLEQKIGVLQFLNRNDHYFLNLSMPYSKLALQAGHGVKHSTVCTVMARNGVEFGLKISSSDKWFVGPANFVEGLFFPGFTNEDAARDIGDSSITETMGLGGFAMGSAPAIVRFVGGSVQDALNYSMSMHEICHGENSSFTIPTLDFRPTALGIDAVKVVESGILPIINTGIAHKEPGIGQVGAGLVTPPMQCFIDALKDYASALTDS